MYEVNPKTPEFAPTRDALVATLRTTAASAAEYLKGLRATQFERLAEAVRIAKNDEQRVALVRIAIACTLAEDAMTKANEAAASVGRLPADHSVEGLAADLTDQACALAIGAKASAEIARKLIALQAVAEEPVDTDPDDLPPNETGGEGSQGAEVVAPDEPSAGGGETDKDASRDGGSDEQPEDVAAGEPQSEGVETAADSEVSAPPPEEAAQEGHQDAT